ncbi:DnaD domain protein [Streptococcus parauberis]|uniref:DnaD domain protein n=1 Tax=Streptococcus parauberis TaxID=1348 RepID=UPI001FB1AEFA|nr:DnaD domain protein [Streptococcus parauberis]
MGNRRMISKTVTQTQRFLQMPLESQALYFHLIQNSDDDGIVEAFPIVRMIGATDDGLKLLQAKSFIKPLNDEMVYFIIDFFEQNQIKSNQYKKSIYQSLLSEEDKSNNLRILDEFKNVSKVEQVLNPNISQYNQSKSNEIKDNVIKENQIKDNVIEDRSVESKTTSKQKKDIYIDSFDATEDFSKIRNIEDFLGDDYLTNLNDDELITGFTQYYLSRVPDTYELNTLKKRLKTIDREILQQAYKQASMNGADTLAYIVATLKNWEERNINTLDDWNKHELQREQEKDDDDLPF